MTAERIAKFEDLREGRTVPRWKYWVIYWLGLGAIVAARISGRADDGGAWSWSWWVFLVVMMAFSTTLGILIRPHMRRTLV